MNLLRETLTDIERSGHTPADVVYIGSRDGYACTWEQFTQLADREYDNGYGGQEVAADLEIHFSDGGWLERGECDGKEWWEYRPPFTPPTATRPIATLLSAGSFWNSLAYLNDIKEDQ